MALRLRVKELIDEKGKRERKRLTPTDVAREIGVSHNTILGYVEDRVQRPALEILDKLQDYFGCSIEELFEKVDDLEVERVKT